MTVFPTGRRGDDPGKILRISDRPAVEVHDDIPLLEPRLVGRTARNHLRNEGAFAFLEAERLGQFRGNILDGDPQQSPGDVSPLLKLGLDLLGHVDRDRKPDPLTGGDDGGVDAHDLPLQVDQGAAAVAGVDGGVGLDEVVIGARADHPAFGADDSGGHRLFQSEGTSDGHHPVAHL